MKDYLEIGCAPSFEDCAQVGEPDYPERSRKECQAFLNQLMRKFSNPPDGAKLSVRTEGGEYSTRDVVCWFDPEKPKSYEYALKIERNTPMFWDNEAREELGLGRREEDDTEDRGVCRCGGLLTKDADGYEVCLDCEA